MNPQDAAFINVKERLKSGVWVEGERLPPLSVLAKQCSVSRTTMWRALTLLKKESLVQVKKRGAISAGTADHNKVDASVKGFAWERLKERIGSEILSSGAASRKLPPINKMALQHGVAIDTLKKALGQLVREGLLVREGRAFHTAQGRTFRHLQTLVLIAGGSDESNISIAYPRIEQIVDSFERECLQLGFTPKCEGFNPAAPRALLDMTALIKSIPNSSGYVVSLGNLWDKNFRQRWFELITFLAGRGLPIVLIDEHGQIGFPEEILHRNNIRVLRIAGVRAGEQVAQTLLHAGHRHIAYLMHLPGQTWIQERYSGLCRYYRQYGGAGAVVELHTLSDNLDDYDLALAMLNPDEALLKELFIKRFRREEVEAFSGRLKNEKLIALSKAIPPTPAKRAMRATLDFLLGLVRQGYDPFVINQELERLLHLATDTAREWYLEKLFKDALEDKKVTAWVCPSDQISLSALLFLRKRAINVPRDISIIGFENWREAREYFMSTFDFNMHGLVQQALLMIMDEKRLKGQPTICEVDGFVVERRTTRR